jgi:hypothetical protein
MIYYYNIGGINVTRIEHKLSQFADDTSLILDGSEKSLNEALLELDWYAKISGLNINFTKTQVVWNGSKKYSNELPRILMAKISAHKIKR